MGSMAQRSIRIIAAAGCAMGLVLSFVPAVSAVPVTVPATLLSHGDQDDPDNLWLVDEDIMEPLIASGVLSRAQASSLMASYNIDSRLRSTILLTYQRRAEAAVAQAHGMTVQEYESTPMRNLPKLTKSQKTKLNAVLTSLARDLRIAMNTPETSGTTFNKRTLKVVPPKPKR